MSLGSLATNDGVGNATNDIRGLGVIVCRTGVERGGAGVVSGTGGIKQTGLMSWIPTSRALDEGGITGQARGSRGIKE